MRVDREKGGELEEGEISPESNGDNNITSITFFISNLPDDLSTEKLKEEYGRCGQLVDAYIARKRDRFGKVFAFVRYAKVKDPKKMVKALNSVRFFGWKTFAKVARFGKEERLMKNKGKIAVNENQTQVNKVLGSGETLFTYRDTLTGETKNLRNQINLLVLEDKESEHTESWKGRSVVGVANNFESLCKMETNLSAYKDMRIELRYLGGMKILMTFSSPEKVNSFLNMKDFWSKWFVEVYRWDGQNLQFEKIVWLRIVGLPISLLCEENAQKIGELFGSVISDADNGIRESDLTSVYVGVIVNHGRRIKEEVRFKRRNSTASCWVSEASANWVPDFVKEETVVVGVEDVNSPVNDSHKKDAQSASVEGLQNLEESACSGAWENNIGDNPVKVQPENGEHGPSEMGTVNRGAVASLQPGENKWTGLGHEIAALGPLPNNQPNDGVLNDGVDGHFMEINDNVCGEGKLFGNNKNVKQDQQQGLGNENSLLGNFRNMQALNVDDVNGGGTYQQLGKNRNVSGGVKQKIEKNDEFYYFGSSVGMEQKIEVIPKKWTRRRRSPVQEGQASVRNGEENNNMNGGDNTKR